MTKAIEILLVIEIAVLILITLRFAITVWMDFIKDISRSSELPKFKASIEASVKSVKCQEVREWKKRKLKSALKRPLKKKQ